MPRAFGLTFDYLCPFARNVHEHVVVALRDGADWEVEFLPFSLVQAHVEEGELPVWDRPAPDAESGVLALQVGLAVRDTFPDRFLDVHESLFAARHDQGRDLKDPAVLREVVTTAGLEADEVFDLIADGRPLKTLREEHNGVVADYGVWGVPTFIAGGRGVFVRVLDRPEGDAVLARQRIEEIVDLVVDAPMLHEFKQADLPV